MEAVCVRAELRLKNGQNRTVSVPVGSSLSALRGGISELNTNVSRLLSELVERESARDDEDKDGDEDEDEDGDEDALDPEPQPAAKKSKTVKNF